jgi:hypothetical protein
VLTRRLRACKYSASRRHSPPSSTVTLPRPATASQRRDFDRDASAVSLRCPASLTDRPLRPVVAFVVSDSPRLRCGPAGTSLCRRESHATHPLGISGNDPRFRCYFHVATGTHVGLCCRPTQTRCLWTSLTSSLSSIPNKFPSLVNPTNNSKPDPPPPRRSADTATGATNQLFASSQ